jgi:hypothetical protein
MISMTLPTSQRVSESGRQFDTLPGCCTRRNCRRPEAPPVAMIQIEVRTFHLAIAHLRLGAI